jgi:hypothetical protein
VGRKKRPTPFDCAQDTPFDYAQGLPSEDSQGRQRAGARHLNVMRNVEDRNCKLLLD